MTDAYPREHRDPFSSFIVTGVEMGSAMVDTSTGDMIPMVRVLVLGRWNRGIDSELELFVPPAIARRLAEDLPGVTDTSEINHMRWELDGRPLPPTED